MKHKKKILVLLTACVVAAVATAAVWLFSKDKIQPGTFSPEKPSAQGEVATARASIESVTEWYDAVGTVQPRSQARIEAQISAQINEVRVNAGDQVSAGQLLVVLDDRQMKARLSQADQSLKTAISQKEQARQAVNAAEAAFAEAESAYKRVKGFFDAEAATEQDLEQARSRYLQAKAGFERSKDGLSGASAGGRLAEEIVAEAKIGLGYTEVKAPADGEVLKRLVDPGDLAMPGKPLLLLRTTGGLRLEAYVRESLINKAKPGSILQVELTTLNQVVDTPVEELIPFADPQTRTFLVKTGLPDIPGLYPGMYGKLRIPFREAELVLIPRAAIEKVGQLELVMVKADDRWSRRYIKTGNPYGDKIEVLSGLSGGEILKLKEPGNDD